MKLQYCSDLHLEFRMNREFIRRAPLEVKGDILLLAGDIVLLRDMDAHNDFWSYVSDNFQHTYWVPGNHEYYHSNIAERGGTLNEQIRSNVRLVNNVAIEQPGVKLIFSTMWSRISPANALQIQQGMSDFHVIKNNGKNFTPAASTALHEEAISFIKQAVAASAAAAKVVVSHHVPTFMHYPEQYKGDALNEAFATELCDYIDGSDIFAWIYGHHHSNTPSFSIGNTQLLTNQLGYVQYGEHRTFDAGKTVEV